MRVRDLYPLITTPALFAVRDFYVRYFGFAVIFEASWCVYLAGEADGETRGAAIAFLHPDHPSSPPGPEPFDGRGVTVTIEVADARVAYAVLTQSDAPIVHPLTDEEWGQRRFTTKDPAGVLVDVVEQREPAPGYWEQFPPPGR
jgi:catechol 2,3-dioxygenase-like lactoylglutathione lyase family enzyme